MRMRIKYSFREHAGIIVALTATTVVLVGLIAVSNSQQGLVDDFHSPYASVVGEIDGILPSGLAAELIASSPELAGVGGFVSAETQGRSTEPPLNSEGLITGEPPSSLGADAILIPSSTAPSDPGGSGPPGAPGGSGGGAPINEPTTTGTPRPTPSTSPGEPPPEPSATTT